MSDTGVRVRAINAKCADHALLKQPLHFGRPPRASQKDEGYELLVRLAKDGPAPEGHMQHRPTVESWHHGLKQRLNALYLLPPGRDAHERAIGRVTSMHDSPHDDARAGGAAIEHPFSSRKAGGA